MDVVTKILIWDLLVCLEQEDPEILSDLASGSQQVNQTLDIGIKLGNVVADGCNICVQGAEFSQTWRTVERVSTWLSWMMTLSKAIPHGRLSMVYSSLQIMTLALASLVSEFKRQW